MDTGGNKRKWEKEFWTCRNPPVLQERYSTHGPHPSSVSVSCLDVHNSWDHLFRTHSAVKSVRNFHSVLPLSLLPPRKTRHPVVFDVHQGSQCGSQTCVTLFSDLFALSESLRVGCSLRFFHFFVLIEKKCGKFKTKTKTSTLCFLYYEIMIIVSLNYSQT